MKVPKRAKAGSRKLPAKRRKTFRSGDTRQIEQLIDLANALNQKGVSQWSVAEQASLVRDELIKGGKEANGYDFWSEVLTRCLKNVPDEVKDFVMNVPAAGNRLLVLQQAIIRYENLRESLRKLSVLARANKLILQRYEERKDVAILARAYFDGRNDITHTTGLNELTLRSYKQRLYRIRAETERYERKAEESRIGNNQIDSLLQSLGPMIIEVRVDKAGTLKFVKDLFSEEIEGVKGAASRVRECEKCSHLFWARNIKTVTCEEHRKARQEERKHLSTKQDRLSGRTV